MTPTTVEPTPQPGTPATPAAGAPAAGAVTPAAPGPDAAALKTQVEQLTAQLAEQQRAAEFWHGKASEKPATDKSAAPAAAAAEEPEVDILDLATKGGKAFDKYLEGWAKKNGYVRGEEMTSAINERAAQLATEAELTGRYPELKKHDSEMFKTTAGFYGELKKDGVSERVAMTIAAERAELQLLREGKVKTPAEEKATRETERLARIKAQGGDRGERATAGDENDTELTPDQRRVALSMLKGEMGEDGKPMDEAAAIAAYTKRAQKGVHRFGGKA